MATVEDEIRDLKAKNSELVQKVQYWKLAAAAKENDKLELMKEINELRLKLGRLRSGGAAQARKLDAALQSASEEALSHLVQASSAVARTLELAKTYIQDRQDLDNSSPRWSAIGGTPKTERVHRVPPMMMGGQSIQPVVSLSRTIFNGSNSMSASRTTNPNRSITERAVPMHMLQDVYIPLRRIDASDFPSNNMEIEIEGNNEEDSAENNLEDSAERSGDDLQNMSDEEFDASRRLDVVTEDPEPEDEILTPPSRSRADNPLEGPSWLLDCPTASRSRPKSLRSRTLEPDSTTEPEENALIDPPVTQIDELEPSAAAAAAPAFTPTVRRRKRASSPPRPPSLSPLVIRSPPARGRALSAAGRRLSTSGRVLKVLVAKMRLDSGDGDADDVSPPKRPSLSSPARDSSPTKRLMRFDAPSPNGATDAGVIVSEDTIEDVDNDSKWIEMKVTVARRDSRHSSHDSRKNQDRLVNVDTRDRRLASTDSSNRVRNTSHNRLANDVIENGEDNIGDRDGNIRDSAVDSDDSGEQNIENKRKCVVNRQRLGNNCIGDGNSSRLVSVGDSSRLASVGDSRFGSVGADRDSDSSSNEQVGEGRTRRPRKAVTYKERPLNRKIRR